MCVVLHIANPFGLPLSCCSATCKASSASCIDETTFTIAFVVLLYLRSHVLRYLHSVVHCSTMCTCRDSCDVSLDCTCSALQVFLHSLQGVFSLLRKRNNRVYGLFTIGCTASFAYSCSPLDHVYMQRELRYLSWLHLVLCCSPGIVPPLLRRL